jgi:hypothetical protein
MSWKSYRGVSDDVIELGESGKASAAAFRAFGRIKSIETVNPFALESELYLAIWPFGQFEW